MLNKQLLLATSYVKILKSDGKKKKKKNKHRGRSAVIVPVEFDRDRAPACELPVDSFSSWLTRPGVSDLSQARD